MPSLFYSWAPRAAAQDERPRADKTLSPFFFVEGGDPAVDRLPLKDTHVDVAISGVIADVTVRQVYENHGQRPLHARYVFPASTRAAVYGMTMTTGNTRIVATIKEREKAKQAFQAAKREGKSASLLEESRPNVFTMNVANILPGDAISVELRYTELLVPVDGVYEFVYPTVVGPRYSSKGEAEASDEDAFVKTPYTHAGDPPKSAFHLSGRLSTGVPIQELVSPSHQIVSNPAVPGRADFLIADSDQTPNNRDFILRYRLAGQQIGSGLLLYQGKDENFFLLTAQPPRAVAAEEVPPREYVFVLDVSGSMNGFPLNTAKQLMRDLVKVIRPSDTFNVVVFASGSQTFARSSIPATTLNLENALDFIGPKTGAGGTELLAAIKRALAIPRQPGFSRTVVLITDGYIEAEKDVFDYVRRPSRRGQCLCVRDRHQRQSLSHRGSRARGARRTLRRDRIRRGGGRGGDVPALHRIAGADRHRRQVRRLRRLRRGAEEDPRPVCEPSDRRVRKMARRRGRNGRTLRQNGTRAVPRVDRGRAGTRRTTTIVRCASSGRGPGLRTSPTSAWACPMTIASSASRRSVSRTDC